MRKTRFFIRGLILAMSFAVLAGCGKKTEDVVIEDNIVEEAEDVIAVDGTYVEDIIEDTDIEVPDIEKVVADESDRLIKMDEEAIVAGDEKYASVLEYYRNYIENYDDIDVGPGDGLFGLYESLVYGGQDAVGYTFLDVNGDGEDELIFANINEAKTGYGVGDSTTVYAMWSFINEEPTLIFESYRRSYYSLLKDNKFLYIGNAGGLSTGYAIYSYEAGMDTLTADKFFLTDAAYEGSSEMGFFVNNQGIWDRESSEIMAEEAFWDDYNQASAEMASVELKYIIERDKYGVGANYTSRIFDSIEGFESFDANTGGLGTSIAIYTTDDTVKGIHISKLSFVDVDNNGDGIFNSEELYYDEKFDIENPLVVLLAFQGDTPEYGLSFTDKDGNERNLGLNISGMDGSIVLFDVIVK